MDKRQELRRTIHPRLVYSIKMGGRNVPPVVVGNVTRFFYLYMIVFSTLTLLISLTGISMLDSMGIIAACMRSVGPVSYTHLVQKQKRWKLFYLMTVRS